MTTEHTFVDAVRSRGGRLTRQRRLVLEILEGANEHLDAEALFEAARRRDPRISLATVYRSLGLLKELGLVAEERLGESHGHFEATGTTPHYHFTCLGCGQVVELRAERVEAAARRLAERAGLNVTTIDLHLQGYCADCVVTSTHNPENGEPDLDRRS